MGDDVVVQVVAQVAIEARPDVLVHRLQLDEHQRQAVDKAHQVGTAVVVGRAQASELEFTHHQKTVVSRVAKVDHRCLRLAQLPLRIAVADRHPIPHQFVKRLVVLQQRARKVMARQLDDGVFNGRAWQLRVEFDQRRAQVAHQHHVALAGAAQRAGGAKSFLIPGIDAVPAQHLLQMLGKGGLHQTVFAVDVGVGHGSIGSILAQVWIRTNGLGAF